MEPIDVTYDISRCYVEDQQGVDPALINHVLGKLRARDLAGLASCSRQFDRAKHAVADWRFLRQVEAFFKKNALFAHQDICEDAAKASFVEAETQCSDTNIRLSKFINAPHLLDAALLTKINRMKSYISRVLGDFSPFLNELPELVRVTPGATAHSARRNSLPQLKMRSKLYATRNASTYLKALYHHFGFGGWPKLKTVKSNRVELVPKNWKTHRTIACEPEGNLPLQLAFDKYAKRKLKRNGIDLGDQSRNQRLAKEASILDNLVTVDFSKASDTISFNVVSWLFPVDWFKFLFDVRSPAFRGAFGEGVYAKFSSMGNGSTFCIETLIFAAACYAVGSKRFSVYGDDVIMETGCYDDYINLTRFLGFHINQSKSFAEGPFRESCGADWYDGVNVTPVYIRSIDKRKANLCHLVNSIGCLASPDGKLQRYLFDFIEENKLPLVPFNESTLSGVWIDPVVAYRQGILIQRRWKDNGKRLDGIDVFKAYVAKNRRRTFVDSRGYYLWFLYKNSQVLFSSPWEVASISQQSNWNETSTAPVYDHKYVRKRVGWQLPSVATPDHLYWWSDLLVARLMPPTRR